MRRILTALLLCLSSLYTYGQERTVSGKVISAEDQQPIPGVSVTVKGSSIGTATDIEGNYSIPVPGNDAVLVFTFLGMAPLEETVGEREIVNVSMSTEASELEEVVVIGYGTATRGELTGSISSVRGEELVRQPVLTPTQAMQSKMAGVQVVASGAPGNLPQVRIRGTGTILAGADPLYIVDGVITTDIRNINNADIVSMDILKDASATAIYGVRAANGVVLITTKKGQTGPPQLTYDGSVGMKDILRRVDMAGPELYMDYANEALLRDNPGSDALIEPSDITGNTDWLEEITRQAMFHNHNLSLSGGSENITYFVSANYQNEEGLLKGNSYERLSVRNNNEYRINEFVRAGTNISLARFESTNKPFSAFTSAYRQAPTAPARLEDGTYGFPTRDGSPLTNVANPLASLDYTNDRHFGLRLQGVVFAEMQLLEGLQLRSSFSIESADENTEIYNPVYEVTANQRNEISNLRLGRIRQSRWVWDNTLTYSKLFADLHDFRMMIGTTAEEGKGHTVVGTRQNVPPQRNYWYLDAGDQASATNESFGFNETRNSYFGRLNYGFDNRYLLTATLRYDGSSKFGSDNRWGWFPSVGVAWRMSQESFMQGIEFLNDLKLRASWGRVGNDRIDPSAFVYLITPGLDYPLGNDQDLGQGYTVADIKDLDLRWEVTTELDFGLEFTALDNQLSGNIDYYDKLTTDALIFRPIDAVFGDENNSFLTNAADIRNRGVEFALQWRNRPGTDWNYTIGANLTFNRNEIEEVGGGIPIHGGGLGNGQVTTRTEVGEPIGSFWLWETDGLLTQADIDGGYPVISGAQPGDLKYVDVSGPQGVPDGVIDDLDRRYMGSYQPKFFYGINGSVSYGQFDLSLDLYGNAGNKVYNGKKAQRFGNENVEASLAGRWTENNMNTDIPRASNEVPRASDYYLESGSFFRLNNVTLGYTLAENITKRWGIGSVRFFLTAQNPFIIQDFSGFTPELPGAMPAAGTNAEPAPSTLNSGIELDAYPTTKTFLFGLNVGF